MKKAVQWLGMLYPQRTAEERGVFVSSLILNSERQAETAREASKGPSMVASG